MDVLLVFKNGREYSARAASGSGDDNFACRVLFADGKGICAYKPVFFGLRSFVDMALPIQYACSAFGIQAAGQNAVCLQTLLNRIFHRIPNFEQIRAYFFALESFYVLRN